MSLAFANCRNQEKFVILQAKIRRIMPLATDSLPDSLSFLESLTLPAAPTTARDSLLEVWHEKSLALKKETPGKVKEAAAMAAKSMARQEAAEKTANKQRVHISIQPRKPNEGMPGNARTDNSMATSALIAGLVVIFCLIAANLGKFRRVAGGYVEDLRSSRSRNNLFDDHTTNESYLTLLLALQYIIYVSILLFGYVAPHGLLLDNSQIAALGMVTLLVGAYYVFQLTAYSMIGYTFGIGSSPSANARMMSRNFIASQNLAGIALLIPAVTAFLYPTGSKAFALAGFAIYITARLVFVSKCFRIFYINFTSLLYFILYLCSLEIIPAMLIYDCACRVAGAI